MIVMNSGSQLSELKSVSQMSQDAGIVFVIVFVIVFLIVIVIVFVIVFFVGQVMSPHHSDQMSRKIIKSLGSLCSVLKSKGVWLSDWLTQ